MIATRNGRRYRRNPLLQPAWSAPGRFEVRDLHTLRRYRLNERSYSVLNALGEPLDIDQLASDLHLDLGAAVDLVEHLSRLGLIVTDNGSHSDSVIDWWTPAELAVQRQAPAGGMRSARSGDSPPSFKEVNGAHIALPEPDEVPSRPLAEILRKRRTKRTFRDEPLTLPVLSLLLNRAARVSGYVNQPTADLTFRPYPSAGARHSLEIYLFCNHVDGVPPGVYHYHPDRHVLTLVRDASAPAYQTFLDATAVAIGRRRAEFPVVLYLTSVFERVLWKYKATGLLSIYRDAGCLLQTLYLVATDLGLAGCAVAALASDGVADWLGHDPVREGHVGSFVLGWPQSGSGDGAGSDDASH